MKRRICHNCGYEVTNQNTYKIYDDQTKWIIDVCKLCKVRHDRKRQGKKNNSPK